ncbi:PREDICTED: GPI-anchored protein LORELEI-like [Nelumbo nucifera]|uniref:GPI-anchored protein LORELEI-like n=1 Tax=Nelumbo nucifera TaxID=4432 RepID=A0A1U8AFF4_NELNU|nr:PREDICTED: GPI-anchored protein LORELEI-like [Nelumbo nucifera]
MVPNRCLSAALLFLLWMGLADSSSFISDNVFDCHGSTGRNLLQAKKSCPVNFEFLNYSVITSQCKGPKYSPNLCCGAFKEFACPYAVELNDLTNDCSSTMFSYINLYGKYPPGLFSSECREGKEGLACPLAPEVSPNDAIRGQIGLTVFPLLVLISSILMFLFQML